MQFDTKIAIIVRDDLAAWQALNVTAFLSGGIAGCNPDVMGEPYRDASGQSYSSLIRQPIMVFEASGAELSRTLERALSRNIQPAVYTHDMFSTGHDEANRAAVASVQTGELDLVGLGIYADRKIVDKVIKGLKLHG